MSAEEEEIDFEVLREPWNKYELDDGSYIKSRYVLTKFRRSQPDSQGKRKYSIDGQVITVVYNALVSLKGTPSSETYSSEQILASIETEVGYKTLEEDWNEYFAEDGSKIRIKDTVLKVSRSRLKDLHGDPVYWVEHSQLLSHTPPKK